MSSPPPALAPALRAVSGWLLVASCLAAWEWAARGGSAAGAVLPPLSEVLRSLYDLTVSLELPREALASLFRVLAGFALGCAVGYPVGFASGLWPRLGRALSPLIEFLRPMPSVALIPLGILFLGLGDRLNVAVIAFASSWPVLVATRDALSDIDPVLRDTARTLGRSRPAVVLGVLIPATFPRVAVGLRIGLGIAVAVVVVSEMIVSQSGLGSFIMTASLANRAPDMYAGIVAVGLFGYGLNAALARLLDRLTFWRRGFSHGGGS